MTNAFRARADELGTARSAARFRSGTSLAEGPELNRVVAQAVARAKTGDQEAFRFLYLRYADNVYGYVTSIVRDEYEAEDVTQHVFTKLITTLPKYEQREVPFAAWILRVARNVAVDHMRAAPRRPLRGGPRAGAAAREHRRGVVADAARGARHAARRPARGHRPAPRRRPQPRRDRRAGSARPSRPCTDCTTAAAAPCAPC